MLVFVLWRLDVNAYPIHISYHSSQHGGTGAGGMQANFESQLPYGGNGLRQIALRAWLSAGKHNAVEKLATGIENIPYVGEGELSGAARNQVRIVAVAATQRTSLRKYDCRDFMRPVRDAEGLKSAYRKIRCDDVSHRYDAWHTLP